MGTDKATVAAGTAQAQRWAASGWQQGVPDGDLIRASHWYPLGIPSRGDGVRERGDLLASLEGLAEGRGLAEDTQAASGQAGPGTEDPVGPGSCGLLIGAGSFWGAKTGPNPTDRAKAGSKRHVLTDGSGVPLAIELTGANTHDSQVALRLVDSVAPVRSAHGRPRQRPAALAGDKAYDSAEIRRGLRRRGIRAIIPMRYEQGDRGVGKIRWVVERTVSWLNQFRRLRVRYERRPDIHEAFVLIGCVLICWNFLHIGF